jgi:signal transduction histidine kinase
MAIISIIKIMVQTFSYDIVKAHGGKIKVETQEDLGSEFIIQLPITMSFSYAI